MSEQVEVAEQVEAPAVEASGDTPTQAVENAVAKYAEEGDLDKIVRFTVNGKVVEKPVRQLLGEERLDQASHERFRQASALAKQSEEKMRRMLEDPVSFFKEHGKDFDDLAMARVRDRYAESQMTDEQKEHVRLQQEHAQLRKQLEEREAAQKEERIATMSKEIQEGLSAQFIRGLEANPDLPKNEQTVSRMAYYYEQALQHRIPTTLSEIIQRVRNDLGNEHQSLYKDMNEEQLEKILGREKIEKLARYAASKVKRPEVPKTNGSIPNPKGKQPAKFNPYTADIQNIKNLT